MKRLGLDQVVTGETGIFQGEDGRAPEKPCWLAKNPGIIPRNRAVWRKTAPCLEKPS